MGEVKERVAGGVRTMHLYIHKYNVDRCQREHTGQSWLVFAQSIYDMRRHFAISYLTTLLFIRESRYGAVCPRVLTSGYKETHERNDSIS